MYIVCMYVCVHICMYIGVPRRRLRLIWARVDRRGALAQLLQEARALQATRRADGALL
jgi:hypothetical protein